MPNAVISSASLVRSALSSIESRIAHLHSISRRASQKSCHAISVGVIFGAVPLAIQASGGNMGLGKATSIVCLTASGLQAAMLRLAPRDSAPWAFRISRLCAYRPQFVKRSVSVSTQRGAGSHTQEPP